MYTPRKGKRGNTCTRGRGQRGRGDRTEKELDWEDTREALTERIGSGVLVGVGLGTGASVETEGGDGLGDGFVE